MKSKKSAPKSVPAPRLSEPRIVQVVLSPDEFVKLEKLRVRVTRNIWGRKAAIMTAEELFKTYLRHAVVEDQWRPPGEKKPT